MTLALALAILGGVGCFEGPRSPITLTGDKLPSFVRAMLNAVPRDVAINADQVVVICDLERWFDANRVPVGNRTKIKKKAAFILGTSFPIYIPVGGQEWFQRANAYVVTRGRYPGVYVWAAILVHEALHVGGASERIALGKELDLLHELQKRGVLEGAEEYVHETEEMLRRVEAGPN